MLAGTWYIKLLITQQNYSTQNLANPHKRKSEQQLSEYLLMMMPLPHSFITVTPTGLKVVT